MQSVEGVIIASIVVVGLLGYLLNTFSRSRPDFRVLQPFIVAFGLRVLAIAGISATGLSSALRGGDELTFLSAARFLASTPLGHGFLPHGPYQLQVVTFALEMKLGFLDQGAMRIVQVGIAMVGMLLIVAAVYDLSGGRAARLAAWVMAFEPASIFFDSALHKEPLMDLAGGLIVYGGTRIWQRLDVRGILLCGLGGLVAVETRAYAGWFLVSAAVFVLLHAALRNMDRPTRAMPAIYAVTVIAFVAVPVVIQESSKKSLQYLQASQTANSTGAGEATGGANGDNLALEEVDYSSRGAILTSLPKRIRDVLLKPYPWQLADNSQRFGALGTMFAYAVMLLLIRYAWLARRRVMAHIGPIVYPALFSLIAYSLSAGNAGTGFRYRTHLVWLGIAMMAILREQVAIARAESRTRKQGQRSGLKLDVNPAHSPL